MDPITFGKVINQVHRDKNTMPPEEYIKYRASIITTREKDQAAENNFIAQLVNPSSPSRPETPLQGIDARPETPNAVVVRELDTTDEESDSDSYDYTEDEIAVLTYIDQYKPLEAELVPELHPFVIEYMAAFGEVDSFIKVPRPDEIDDNIGLMFLDEPPSNQSDAAIVDMQIRHATKDAAYLDDEVPVKILEKADEKPDEIKKWIADIKTLHKSQPATTVHYKTKLPDIETLMQEWSPRLEEIMRTVRLPTAELDVSLEKYVDICLNILDIPVGKSRIEALHVMFSLLNEFSNSQHFRNLAQNNNRLEDSRERMDRLEL